MFEDDQPCAFTDDSVDLSYFRNKVVETVSAPPTAQTKPDNNQVKPSKPVGAPVMQNTK